MQILVVVDMQKDFIDGVLGTAEAVAIVPKVRDYVSKFIGRVIFTRDTHAFNYLETQEGRKLPVEHCIKHTPGWEIEGTLKPFVKEDPIDKPTFGSPMLAAMLQDYDLELKSRHNDRIESVTLIGLCTDICVISNAMLVKSFMPEVPVRIVAECCAGVTPESHANALKAMAMCQIEIV